MPGSMCRWTAQRVHRGCPGQDPEEAKVASEPEALIAWFAAHLPDRGPWCAGGPLRGRERDPHAGREGIGSEELGAGRR